MIKTFKYNINIKIYLNQENISNRALKHDVLQLYVGLKFGWHNILKHMLLEPDTSRTQEKQIAERLCLGNVIDKRACSSRRYLIVLQH